ncbi:MAG: U32 family peptidase [Bacteriovoracaceae bacterium]|nr:U32 family peptidase [Bacteriovoracaceae bacterium]
MLVVTYVQNMRELGLAKEAGVEEVIISVQGPSRFGLLDSDGASQLAKEAKALGMKTVLELDALLTEEELSEVKLSELALEDFDCLRVQDPGLLELVMSNTDKKIQLILEGGNHNLLGLQGWKEYLGTRLDRLVLSIELPKNKLREYKEALGVAVEFLVLGRILLFYTPRNLLSAMLPEDDELRAKPQITAVGESEESPHKGFPVLENKRGTFMFHIKHQYLLEHLDELEFLDAARVDLRFDSDFELIKDIQKVFKGELGGKEFKAAYPFDVIKGFYQVNKSDVLFKKLKNNRIQRKDENYVGEVLEIQKGSHQAIRLKGRAPIKKGMELLFITPEGKEKYAPVVELKNTKLEDIEQSSDEGLVLMNYLSGVWVKSQVYIKS